MDKGTVLAHPFTRHPGGFISEKTGEVHKIVWAALERGVNPRLFGHGSHFSFAMGAPRCWRRESSRTRWAPICNGYNRARAGTTPTTQARTENPFLGVAPFWSYFTR